MAKHYKDIQFSIADRVARISFAHPPLNILTISMMKEIVDAIGQAGVTSDICAVVLAGSSSSRAFCAGVSIEEHRPETVFQMLESFHAIFRALNTASKPVVA